MAVLVPLENERGEGAGHSPRQRAVRTNQAKKERSLGEAETRKATSYTASKRERERGNEKDLPSIFPDEGQRKGKENGDREPVMPRVRFGLASTLASATRRP